MARQTTSGPSQQGRRVSERGQSTGLLAASEVRRLGGLMFVARRMVEGLYAGRHRSPKRGHSTEFYDYRSYTPGDEPRRVDWRLYGRSDRLYVRRFRHDAELTVQLVIDRSASMRFAGQAAERKWLIGQRLAAALAFLAVRQSDRIGLSSLGESGRIEVAAGGGWGHLQSIIARLETMEPSGSGAGREGLVQLHQALSGTSVRGGGRGGKRGLLIVIGDWLDEPGQWLAGLRPFFHDRWDVVGFSILSRAELDLSGVGSARLVDMEGGGAIRTDAAAIRAGYRAAMREHLEVLRRGIIGHGGDFRQITTDEPLIEALRGFVASRRGM